MREKGIDGRHRRADSPGVAGELLLILLTRSSRIDTVRRGSGKQRSRSIHIRYDSGGGGVHYGRVAAFPERIFVDGSESA
jgi:hypothetical protein